MKDPEFDAVVHEAAESLVGRTVFRFAGYFSTAWESSALVGAVREWTAPFQYWPVDQRVRMTALTLAWAGVWHGLGLLVLPKYVTSGLPQSWTVAFVVWAVIVAAMPDAFVRAWRDRFSQRQNSKPSPSIAPAGETI